MHHNTPEIFDQRAENIKTSISHDKIKFGELSSYTQTDLCH